MGETEKTRQRLHSKHEIANILKACTPKTPYKHKKEMPYLNKNHYLKDIIGSKSNKLVNRKIALCITGSVAATKSPEIARQLMRHGAEIFTVMSPMAQTIIHPYLMEWATGNPVITELTGKTEHIMLAGDFPGKVDLILLAPATANTISKIACGIDDTPVTTVISTAFGSNIPIMVVPAMHESMYRHPIVAENIKKLQSLKIKFIGPRVDEGKAKIAKVKDIVEAVIHQLTSEKIH
jgi:phosphopantothenoylcysteine decarboxylase/phosphopantothenate--cysteine ligase